MNIKKVFICMIILLTAGVAYGRQVAELQVAVFYTQAAESSIGSDIRTQIGTQINVINNVLDASGITKYRVDQTSVTKLDTYKEPRHSGRSNKYLTYSFDGTIQVMDELINHEALRTYHSGTTNPNRSIVQQSQLEDDFISLDNSVNPDVVLLIVDESGPPMISQEALLNYRGTAPYREPIFALVTSQAFKQYSNALALIFFDLFASRDAATVGSTNTLMSFWRDDVTSVSNSLSVANRSNFRCSANKLELGSASQVRLNGVSIDRKRTSTEISGESSVVMQPNGKSAVLSLTNNSDAYIALTRKRFKPNGWTPPVATCAPLAKILIADQLSDEEQAQKQELSEELKVYPNPFTDEFSIRFAGNGQQSARLLVFDMQGRLVSDQLFELNHGADMHNIRFDATDLKMGMYIYRLKIGETLHSGTIIKEYKP